MASGEQIVRDAWARWNAGEREPDPELFHPEIEIHSALTGDVYKGEAGLRRWTAEIDEQFEQWEVTPGEIRGVSPDRFVAVGSIRAEGRESGVHLDQPAAWMVELRDGRISGLHNFIGHDAGRAAAEAATK